MIEIEVLENVLIGEIEKVRNENIKLKVKNKKLTIKLSKLKSEQELLNYRLNFIKDGGKCTQNV
ncbi:MAG: hypothetical protein ACRC0Y_11115 [Fusobacteriaceae bacterium]